MRGSWPPSKPPKLRADPEQRGRRREPDREGRRGCGGHLSPPPTCSSPALARPQNRGPHTPPGIERAPWQAREAAGQNPGPARSPPESSGARPPRCRGPRAAGGRRSRTSPRGTPHQRPSRPPRPPPPRPAARASAAGPPARARRGAHRPTPARAQPCCPVRHVTLWVTWPRPP